MDPTLEDEVGTECTKYGSVAGVVIFEARPRTGRPVHPQVLKKRVHGLAKRGNASS